MENLKVFSSDIIRDKEPVKNELYHLISIFPATPIETNSQNESTCDFKPTTDKIYVSRRKNKFKVKTVKDIRNDFEKNVYVGLTSELEKQYNILLKKIRAGSSKEEHTKQFAKNLLKFDNPLSRAAWQMLMNINPEGQTHSRQYVLWNGKKIQINGSKGGKFKFIANLDLGTNKIISPKKSGSCHKKNRKLGMLQNSLITKFKPGPLSQKKHLDNSYQKFSVGNIELVNLPKPGLNINPEYGVVFDPMVKLFLSSLRDEHGIISDKWAEFAVSMVGAIKQDKPIQINKESITFDLNYERNQHRMLMRRDTSNTFNKVDGWVNHDTDLQLATRDSSWNASLLSDVKQVVVDMIESIEISLKQNDLYSKEDEITDKFDVNSCSKISGATNKSNNKYKRKFGELERLDVTVINLAHDVRVEDLKECHEPFCLLGCVCSSLNSKHVLKNHCGRLDCMFKCKCDFSKYRVTSSINEDECPELIPGLLNLDNQINSTLAKEEKKFHQTVILTGNKSVLLKSKKRNSKTTKRYKDFYTNMNPKSDKNNKNEEELSVSILKLNCKNVEPWCLVHNLYKCFCKGKFTASTVYELSGETKTETKVGTTCHTNNLDQKSETTCNKVDLRCNVDSRLQSDRKKSHKEKLTTAISEVITVETYNDDHMSYQKCSCSRVRPYEGRKFPDGYYKSTNKKILDLEKNDLRLHTKMMRNLLKSNLGTNKSISISSTDLSSQENNVTEKMMDDPANSTDLSSQQNNVTENMKDDPANDNEVAFNTSDMSTPKGLKNKDKLITWLETSYKILKRKFDKGNIKLTLDAPKQGRLALYPWDFILCRYRERKNLFLITKRAPFRIFLGVHKNHPFFDNCDDIDNIQNADLSKYPQMVKNLITNANDLKDNYCILCGLSYAWELIGSVTKVSDEAGGNKSSCDTNSRNISPTIEQRESLSLFESDVLKGTKSKSDKEIINDRCNTKDENSSSISKWFVMTLEQDFSEVRFFKKGIFIKYQSIMNAINVARKSNKVVRLSSQKEETESPPFGIYAIPNQTECCVFVGPYEKDESLGMETVKLVLDNSKQKRTRGYWITTNKVDNMKMVDNVQFMQSLSTGVAMTPEDPSNNNDNNMLQSTTSCKKNQLTGKMVKPIKIRKTNGFYHLAPNGFLKPVNSSNVINSSMVKDMKTPPLRTFVNVMKSPTQVSLLKKKVSIIEKNNVAATTPHGDVISSGKKQERGMFILKPEEINKRILETSSLSAFSTFVYDGNTESFIATSQNNSTLETDSFVISDDDENNVYYDESELSDDNWKDVYIQSVNIPTLGWIRGRLNNKNYLSFQLPGRQFSAFYQKNEALDKINRVLSDHSYIPENSSVKWEIIENEEELTSRNVLQLADFESDSALEDDVFENSVFNEAALESLTFNTSETLGSVSNSLRQEMTRNLRNILLQK